MLFWLCCFLGRLRILLLVFYFFELCIDNFSFDRFFSPAALAGRLLTGTGLRVLNLWARNYLANGIFIHGNSVTTAACNGYLMKNLRVSFVPAPNTAKEFLTKVPQMVFVSATPSNYEKEHADNVVEQVVRPTGLVDPIVEVRPALTQVDDLLGEIKLRIAVQERVLVTTLTKRMSEDLTDYLSESGLNVRYLHSDIDTVERVEIIRDLRLGVFDVLVGINLLREGLDIPEVSLVAILDADKEGFLRSERSLIQTMGRAARNLNGKAILYADRITDSMRRAMDETERRRLKQLEFNKEHGITARGVSKAVREMIDGVMSVPVEASVVDDIPAEVLRDDKSLAKEIRRLEKLMMDHAKNLEFEQAAAARDALNRLKQKALFT